MRRVLRVLVPILVGLASGSASARDFGASARSLGVGDATQALGMGTAGLYFNPAAMSQITQYAIDAGYGFDDETATHNLHAAVTDSQTNSDFAGGASYTFFKSSRDGDAYEGHDIRAALSGKYGTGDFSIGFGATFRYLHVTGDNVSINYPTLDAGVLVGIKETFFIGVAGQNLIKIARFAPRQLGLGLGFVWNPVNVGATVVLDFESKDKTMASPGGGVEFIAGGVVALRAGFLWDRAVDQKRVTGGLGYISQFIAVDIGYGHDVTNKDNWMLEASVRAFLP